MGAQAQDVTFFSVLSDVLMAFLYLKIPSFMEKAGSLKRTVFPLAAINAVTWIPLIFVMLFMSSVGPQIMIILCAINLVPGRLMVPARDSWIASIVPTNILGNHIGWRATITTTTYLILFFSMGQILDIASSLDTAGFGLIFFIAFVATLLSTSTYSKIQDYPKEVNGLPVAYSFSDFLGEVKNARSSKIIQYVVLLQVAVHLCSPLFAVYMIKELNFSYLMFALVIGSELIGKMLSSIFWGRHSDRVGDIPIVMLVSFIIPLVPLLWLFSSNIIYLVIVQLISGIVWAGFDVSTWSWMHKNIATDKKPRYLTYVFSLSSFSKAIGASIGILLLGLNIEFLGSSILSLFFISGFLRFLVALFTLPGLRSMVNDLEKFRDGHFNSKTETIVNANDEVHREGVYQRLSTLSQYRRSAKAPSFSQGRSDEKPHQKQGLYHNPQEWAAYRRSAEAQSFSQRHSNGDVNQKRSPLQRPQELAEYRKRVQSQPVLHRRNNGDTNQKRGLYHDPQEWAAYRKNAEAQSYSKRRGNDNVNQKSGLFNQSKDWAKAPFFNPYSASW